MTRLFAFLLCLLFPLAATAKSCGTEDLIADLDATDRARLDALVAPHPYPRGNLWRATKDGSTVTVVGTIHIPDARLSAIVERVRPALEAADLLILEASAADEAGLPKLVAEKPEMFFITEGPTMIDLLGEDDWASVARRLSARGIPAFFAAKFQPWYLSMTLAIPPCAMQAIQTGGKGLDRQLEVIALAQGAEIATLDDTEKVLRIFSDEPLEKQIEGLRLALEANSFDEAAVSTLIESYFDERVRESWEFGRIMIENAQVANGGEMFEELNQTLLVGRNRDWEPKIASLVAGRTAVLAVGAAHLSGESGVLRALERAGYTLTRLQ